MFKRSEWIWADAGLRPNDRVNFIDEFICESIPSKVCLKIATETKYWLFINGELAVFDGGLFRESLPGQGYFDEVDIAKYLRRGKNEIIWHVWYFGNGGRNNSFCARAGLLYECTELGLFSGSHTLCERDVGYYTTERDNPSFLYGGHNTAYDARKAPFSLCPCLLHAAHAKTVGRYGDEPWGMLQKRSVPLLRFSDRIPCTYTVCGREYTVELERAMQFSPYFVVEAHGGEVVGVRSDRYEVRGGPGDTGNVYFGHRAEYVCREGVQEFEMRDWIFGEKIIFSVPEGVKVLSLGYRESGYDCKVTAQFRCDDEAVNALFQKCVNTLLVCMRENYMDCPDRERGQWIGDVSVQAPQVIYLLDDNAKALLRKAILDFLRLRKEDRLVGNVPGDNFTELPGQSLNAISEWGMISSYYAATKEKEILQLAFEPAVRYLALWKIDKSGKLQPRKGDWYWFDHLYNVDAEVLEHCWYYSALRFARFMAKELKNKKYDAFLAERMQLIESTFHLRYWKDGRYASGDVTDDRANAMAVLAGLCPPECFESVRYVLLSVFNSSTYMENYVLTALCEMGYTRDAFVRMMSRYQPLIRNENSTLWEDFYHLGTKNHAWSGAPATILIRYFAGVKLDFSLADTSAIAPLNSLYCEIGQGEKHICVRKEKGK